MRTEERCVWETTSVLNFLLLVFREIAFLRFFNGGVCIIVTRTHLWRRMWMIFRSSIEHRPTVFYYFFYFRNGLMDATRQGRGEKSNVQTNPGHLTRVSNVVV